MPNTPNEDLDPEYAVSHLLHLIRKMKRASMKVTCTLTGELSQGVSSYPAPLCGYVVHEPNGQYRGEFCLRLNIEPRLKGEEPCPCIQTTGQLG